MKRNAALTLTLAALSGLADSFWANAVAGGYLLLLAGGRNAFVGYAEAATGLFTLLAALAISALRQRQVALSRVLAAGGLALLGAVGLGLWALLPQGGAVRAPAAFPESYLVLCGALALWGVSGSVLSGPAQAAFEQALDEGSPDARGGRYYAWLFVAWVVPSCVGPALSCLMLHLLPGGGWTLDRLRAVFAVGWLLEVPVAITLFLFKRRRKSPAAALLLDEAAEEDEEEEVEWSTGSGSSSAEAELGAGLAQEDWKAVKWGFLRQRHIPAIMFAGDVLVGLGSGMTVKYFPLFFMQAVGLTPAQVQLVYTILPVAMVGTAAGAQAASRSLGRVNSLLLFRLLGVVCLLAMVYLAEVLHVEAWHTMVPLFLARTALMNSAFPVAESILVDTVPFETRAWWKALEPVHQVGWCASAVLGGWIADRYRAASGGDGYPQAMALTAGTQLVGVAVHVFLVPLVYEERGSRGGETSPLLSPASGSSSRSSNRSSRVFVSSPY